MNFSNNYIKDIILLSIQSALIRIRIFSNLFDFQRVGTAIIHE